MKLAKLLIVAMVVVATAYGAAAQDGTLVFNTTGGAPGQGEVFDLSFGPLGTSYLGQIYTSPTLNGTYAAAGSPSEFGTTIPGYITAGTTVTSPNVAAGAIGYYEIRAWTAAAGGTFEIAVLSPGPIGISVPTLASGPFGGPSTAAPSVNNFARFPIIVPEPSILALGLAGAVGLLLLRRRR